MKHTFQTISVVGLGYIGLPTAAVIAGRGINVIGLDVSDKVIETINSGKVHIVEPDLDIAVQAAVNSRKLIATKTAQPADAFLIAVPTPFVGDDHTPDLSYIESAAKSIAPVLKKGNLVVLESTSPVGATDQLVSWLTDLRPDLKFPESSEPDCDVCVAHCPERVLPGQVLRELVENDRVIGGVTKTCAEKAVALYKVFVAGDCIVTNAKTAEMVKLTENSFRDVNIAFANELSVICDTHGINVWELISLANRHPRVDILKPGAGVGGHCIAVDPWFIVSSNPDEAKLIRTARIVNDLKPKYVKRQIIEKAEKFKNPKIACFGLAFKPNIDDLRESPAMEIVADLAQNTDCEIIAVEPNIDEIPDNLSALENVLLKPTHSALAEADIICFLVAHKQFKEIPNEKFNEKIILDFVNVR